MNVIDIVLLIPLAWGAYKGFSRGIVQEIAQLVALLTGVFAGLHLSDWISSFLIDFLNTGPEQTKLIAFLIAFLGAMALVFLISKNIGKLIDSLHLGLPNRIAGAVFASAKYILILSLLINFINSADKTGVLLKKDIREGSLLYEPLGKAAPLILPKIMKMLPDEDESENNDNVSNSEPVEIEE